MASFKTTDLSDLPSFDINQYSSRTFDQNIDNTQVSSNGGNVELEVEDEFLASEEFNESLNAILNGTVEGNGTEEISPISASDELRDDTMEDALTQMHISLNMKNVDEEDQAQAAMLADALICKVMRTHNSESQSEIMKDKSLWRAHSVLAEVSQIGVWSHNQQFPGSINNSTDKDQSPVTNMKLDNYMRREHSDPIGGWQIP